MSTRQTRSSTGRPSRGTAAKAQIAQQKSDLQAQRRQKQLENLDRDNYGHEENQQSVEESSGSEGNKS